MTVHRLDHARPAGSTRKLGVGKNYEVDLTNAAGTTDRMEITGFNSGSIFNETGGSITINYYSSKKSDSTPRVLKNGTGAVTQTIADGACRSLPTEIKDVEFLVPVLGSGSASGVWFHFENS